MQFQYDYMGGSTPQNLGVLVCSRCLDELSFQNKLLILPPDPKPFFNTRPEPYAVDETNWMTTEGGSVIDTQDGESIITPVPNPSSTESGSEQAAVNLTTEDDVELVTEEGDGNPLDYEPNP